LHSMPIAASPLLTGIAFSTGGDLVIGYGASSWGLRSGGGWRSVTEFHCAVRRYGESFRAVEVDREELVGYDPSVAVLGQGSTLRIFYAYEVRAGVRLAVSDDGGDTFAIEPGFGGIGAHNPTVFARQHGPDTLVDVLYLTNAAVGRELHHARWPVWGSSVRQDYRVTSAQMLPTPPQPGRMGLYGMMAPYDFGLRTTQVNWLGYDAVLDGDQIVVVYDEVTQDAAFLCMAMWEAFPTALASGAVNSPQFQIASPPPLAPGMTEPMPAVDPDHSHQLKLVRID
ncbi:MAG: hypothetical protein KDC98_03040, partial [Planctomycetes bacterium]|nr:hypothetical protein [Planctomycetota bacterium]